MQLLVTDYLGGSHGEVMVSDEVFCAKVHQHAIATTAQWQMSCARSGNHAAKTRSQVNLTSKKAFRQKGTGRARRGNLATNLLRGGGVSHGPIVRSHAYVIPKKVRRLALRSALSSKVGDLKVVVWDSLELPSCKTKDFAGYMKTLDSKSILIVGLNFSSEFQRAANNLFFVDYLPVVGLNVMSLLSKDVIVIEKNAIEAIEKRCI